MTRLLLAAALVVAAVVVASVISRRRRLEAPTQPQWSVPAQLDRRDFARPDAPWLVAVFASTTCDACARVQAMAAPLESPQVAVDDVAVERRAEVHRRYRIEAVPLVVVADAGGVVRASFVGPPPSAEGLWSTVAACRDGAAPPA